MKKRWAQVTGKAITSNNNNNNNETAKTEYFKELQKLQNAMSEMKREMKKFASNRHF
jgi:uncharacterized FlaG/YvyC family protein